MILLVGASAPSLEGLSQTLSAAGVRSRVARSLQDARDIGATERPLIVVVERTLAVQSTAETLSIPRAPGGALVLFRHGGPGSGALSPSLQRVVLADLALPLERNLLLALIQHVEARAKAAGRPPADTPDHKLFS